MADDNSLIESKKAALGKERTEGFPLLDELKVVGNTKLIKNDEGQFGVFTPITGVEKSKIGNENLEVVIDILKSSIGRLQAENTMLRNELDSIKAQNSRTADDFTSAISHTLDSLQNKLASVNNPTSQFAVREFNIEAQVAVDVTELGTIAYRFIKPGEDIQDKHLSKIGLSITPIPKEGQQETWTRTDFTPYHPAAEIQGIGDVYSSRLEKEEIFTVSDLVMAGKSARVTARLASRVGVERDTIARWIGNAELMTIKSINGKTAEILYTMGLHGLKALAETSPEAIVDAWLKDESNGDIALGQVTAWVETAKAYYGNVKSE